MKLTVVTGVAIAGLAACIETSSKSNPADSTSASRSASVVTSTRVNQGTYGMASKVKWLLSPDKSAILVMVDPVGVENEAVPNGFFFGSEARNFQTRMDSVWDVTPSPDWQMLAFSRAYVLLGREADTIPAPMWLDLARKTGIDTATLINGSFASSGMSLARAIAQPGTISVPADSRAAGASDAAAPRLFRIARGWRVRWTPDGATIALGANPARVQDDEESASWAALDPKTGAFHGTLAAGAQLVVPQWVTGPVLDISIPVNMQAAPTIDVVNGTRSFSIRSERGVITARETTVGVDSAAIPFIIGPGKALAATKGGRYIVALAPRATAVAYEVPVEAVVYTVGW
ncbi:MAG: hypothetical protein ABIR58_08255 [Gemmatimonadaceae bacterium]